MIESQVRIRHLLFGTFFEEEVSETQTISVTDVGMVGIETFSLKPRKRLRTKVSAFHSVLPQMWLLCSITIIFMENSFRDRKQSIYRWKGMLTAVD